MADPTGDTSWLSPLLARLALASRVHDLSTATALSRWLTRPSPGLPLRTPSDHGLLWDPLECRTADGMRLVGWVVTPPQPRATIALFHGLRQNRSQLLERIAFLTGAGYRCVAFDHRAHGGSSGKRTSFGYHERHDAIAVLDLVRRLWPNQPRLALGISLGAAALCYAAAELPELHGAVLESLYRDMSGAQRIMAAAPAWLRHICQATLWVTETRLGVRLDQLAPIQCISALAPTPILFVTGAEDRHASPADTHHLAGHYAGSGQVWVAPNAGHEDLCAAGGSAYRQQIGDFLRTLP